MPMVDMEHVSCLRVDPTQPVFPRSMLKVLKNLVPRLKHVETSSWHVFHHRNEPSLFACPKEVQYTYTDSTTKEEDDLKGQDQWPDRLKIHGKMLLPHCPTFCTWMILKSATWLVTGLSVASFYQNHQGFIPGTAQLLTSKSSQPRWVISISRLMHRAQSPCEANRLAAAQFTRKSCSLKQSEKGNCYRLMSILD